MQPDFAVCAIEQDEMHKAIKHGDIDTVRSCIDRGMVNHRSDCGKTPLMTAAYYCQKQIMEILLENGVVINALDHVTKDTAAHYVTMSLCGSIRQCGCMIVLAENGADVNIANEDGYTVFELAEKNGNADIALAYSSVTNPDADHGTPGMNNS
eukprot:NODE_6965_length_612_cov_62.779381_g6942_i0.p1 GENE.NODE_6965_length_612_cov_62.779381_g6942_i0~~NODE_6965_length_612_cov_62.779381_g6942_i0.p1  ORF type:complete len:153 (+),score=23.90 NODE_6965_length_612_cov_62.779381_g6942_i0:54-512(+)